MGSWSFLSYFTVKQIHQGTVVFPKTCSFCLSFLLLLVLHSFCNRPAVNQELSNLFNELWRLDVNRMQPGVDYTISVQVHWVHILSRLDKTDVSTDMFFEGLSLQGRAGFVNQGSRVVQDHASLPLFSNVNENKLGNITTYSSGFLNSIIFVFKTWITLMNPVLCLKSWWNSWTTMSTPQVWPNKSQQRSWQR